MAIINTLLGVAIASVVLSGGVQGYNKYGRSCDDIGCLNSEVCVIREKPCQYHGAQECGRYPTCERAAAGTLNCANLDCPDGQECQVQNGNAMCVSSRSSSSHNSHSDNAQNGGGGLYPSLPSDGTTSRPRPGGVAPVGGGYIGGQAGSGYPGSTAGSGYPGGSHGSGYPGGNRGSGYPGGNQGSGYPGGHQGSGYPGGNQGSGYPGGYNGAGYPNGNQGSGYQGGNQGYGGSNQGGGYSSGGGYGGYPNGQYPAGGQQNGGYRPSYGSTYHQQPPAKAEGPSLTDKITSGLKVIAGVMFALYVHRTLTHV